MTKAREKRYIAEYMLKSYPVGTYELNVPLGPIPQELVLLHGAALATAIYRPSRRRIDAVAWTKESYHLIEAKLRDPFEGLSRVTAYLTMARRTNDLPGYTGQPFKMVLVVPFTLDWIRDAAKDAGIELVEFWQEWIADYVRDRQLYFTKDYREKRQVVQETRRALGLE